MADFKNQWSPLEHQIFRILKDHDIQSKSCLLAVSGGADSMALLEMMSRLQSALKLELTVLHCHHGPAASDEQTQYRNQALEFVRSQCEQRQIPLEVKKSEAPLTSENEMREFRLKSVETLRKKKQSDFALWAHHQEDFLETQILRLIRGGGKDSILEPMSILSEHHVRPFLKTAKGELKTYLENQKIEWLEDPSNADESYLRNWIRCNWLPQLEAKCPGALRSLSRSLDLLNESHIDSISEEIWIKGGILRPFFLTLNEAQKKQVIAIYLRKLGQKEFTHNQIVEIIKHLDIPQLNHTFKSAGLVWSFSKELISAKTPDVVNAI
jgi:tRNA(Ile)-lysidine synthetase-like protein